METKKHAKPAASIRLEEDVEFTPAGKTLADQNFARAHARRRKIAPKAAARQKKRQQANCENYNARKGVEEQDFQEGDLVMAKKSQYGNKMRGGISMRYDEGYKVVAKRLRTVTIEELRPKSGGAPKRMRAHVENIKRHFV